MGRRDRRLAMFSSSARSERTFSQPWFQISISWQVLGGDLFVLAVVGVIERVVKMRRVMGVRFILVRGFGC